jgi:hypothetical protein
MYLNKKTNPDDVLDLHEIFYSLWAHKFIILITCILGIGYGGYSGLTTEKKYTSNVIFSMSEEKKSPFSGQLEAFAGMSSLGGVPTSPLFEEKIFGRIFIENLNKIVDFKNDKFYNSYTNFRPKDPFWKSTLKRIIGYESLTQDADEAIWQGIVRAYSSNISMSISVSGVITISVSHVDKNRASLIANTIMNEIINDQEEKQKKEKDNQLDYFSSTMVDALNLLEKSQADLNDFTMQNSALPLENFASGSLQLDALRNQLIQTTELFDAIVALEIITRSKELNEKDYLSLSKKFPIVDKVEFRRILGQSEVISNWSWPANLAVKAVVDNLFERKERLINKIDSLEEFTKSSQKELVIYAKLNREAKIAEASYAVLIEQVKAHSMSAGYRPNSSTIYEFATPRVSPSSPNLRNYLFSGVAIGLLLGCFFSLLISSYRKVYYSKQSMIKEVDPLFSARSRSLLFLRKKNLETIREIVIKKPQQKIRDLVVEIHNSSLKLIVVTSSKSYFKSSNFAMIIAGYVQSKEMNVAIVDFSHKFKILEQNAGENTIGDFFISERNGYTSFLIPYSTQDPLDFLSKKDFIQKIEYLNNEFDLVIICADNKDAISLIRPLHFQKVFHVMLARVKHTKKEILSQINTTLPIQGLFYD